MVPPVKRKKKGKSVKPVDDGEKNKKRKVKATHDNRKENRRNETTEIKELEARIMAEVPAKGRGLGASGASKNDQKDKGPTLTSDLFADLPISSRSKRGLKHAKFTRMTEIQKGAIPRALAGRDILGEAKTGSGKTLAFLVPVLEVLFRQEWSNMDRLGGLVISPTKELAYQIYQVLALVGGEHEFSAGCVVGGRSIAEEQNGISDMNVLVATPGRLLQHLDESPGFEAGNLQILVMDEADRILDFGFQETLRNILGHLPTSRQSLLFSATLRTNVQRLGKAALQAPEIVSVHQDSLSRTPEKLQQTYMVVPLEAKVNFLFSFLRSQSQKKLIVFVSTCKQVRFFYEAFKLLKPGPAVMELHGRQSLTKRMIIFKEFTEKERSVALFCTDIAARGVDFPAVDWVVQLDCPENVDSYIHRVGRTARYQSCGKSALFLLPSEETFATKLAAARIEIKSIAAKQNKIMNIEQQLSSVLAGNGTIRHLAQKAFVSYLRSLHLMQDAETVKAAALDQETFAQSLGLAVVPEFGKMKIEDGLEKNPLKQQKNMSALQRLREKIKLKKHEKRDAGNKPDPVKQKEEDDEELKEDKEKFEAKKLGRWERRQACIARTRTESAVPKVSLETAPDDLLELAEKPTEYVSVAKSSLKSKRIKIGKDGKAVNSANKRIVFTGEDGIASSELAAVAEELKGDNFDDEVDGVGGGRAAFLRNVANDLQARDGSDAAASRARIHARHQKQRMRGREDARGDAEEGGFSVEFGPASDDDGGGDYPANHPSDSPADSPEPKRPRKAVGRVVNEESGHLGGDSPDLFGADGLGALEREALGKLGSSLFS